jgi:hypothetical protein
MTAMQSDDEINLFTHVAHKVTVVQIKIRAKQISSVLKLEGAHILTNRVRKMLSDWHVATHATGHTSWAVAPLEPSSSEINLCTSRRGEISHWYKQIFVLYFLIFPVLFPKLSTEILPPKQNHIKGLKLLIKLCSGSLSKVILGLCNFRFRARDDSRVLSVQY